MNPLAPVALWGFWLMLAAGWMLGELGAKGTAILVLLWVVGYWGSRFVLQGMLFTPYVAVLDIVLALIVFKGDIRLR